MPEISPNWNPPAGWLRLQTIDLHTAGEPLRVITGGLPEIPGSTILEKRKYFLNNLDYIRTALMWEPRGHSDMYGAIITEPVTTDGDFGVFFMHNEGYSTMCGHAMIALVKLVLETGSIIRTGNETEIRIDAPPGRITAYGEVAGKSCFRSYFRNVPSFVLMTDQTIHVPDIGKVTFDIAYGGAFYAFIDAESFGFKLVPAEYAKLIQYGRLIKRAIMNAFDIRHPFEPDLGFLYGTIFIGAPENAQNHSRNVCVFADGEVDRSPTGSGVSARAALHRYRNQLNPGERISIESIIGSTMTVEIKEVTQYGSYEAVIPEISGTASFTGRHEFWIDPEDPLKSGFLLQ